jgi:hypothetical protein
MASDIKKGSEYTLLKALEMKRFDLLRVYEVTRSSPVSAASASEQGRQYSAKKSVRSDPFVNVVAKNG